MLVSDSLVVSKFSTMTDSPSLVLQISCSVVLGKVCGALCVGYWKPVKPVTTYFISFEQCRGNCVMALACVFANFARMGG